MTWADEGKITPGVRTMLEVNMGWRPGERLLVVADVPRPEDWATQPLPALTGMLERVVLARQVAEIARRMRPEGAVDFVVYPATGGHGAEPPAEVAARLLQADVVIALTTYSLSHTDAREAATHAGVRLASMPGFLAEMFYPDGPMAVDHRQVAAEAEAIARQLTAAREAQVRSPAGTDIRFSLAGRAGMADTGLYLQRGEWGNLPAGEAYIAPVEGTAEGVLVVQAGWHPDLTEEMRLVFHAGQVVEVLGGGRVGEELRRFLRPGDDGPLYTARRNLAELGVGTNPNARRPDNVLEAEKIRGTIHIAVGDNAHMGGLVAADFHEDFVVPEAELWLDGKRVLNSAQMITRREFLRLSLYSMGWAAVWPAYRRVWWQLGEGPVRMGRAIHPVIIYDAPKRDARRIGTWNRDDVFPIVREVRAPGLNAYNDLWYETPDGYVFSAWVQPMWVWPPQVPETNLGDWGFWGEVCVPYTEARKEPHPDAPIVYRFYNGTTYHVVGIAWDDRGNAWYKIYDELPPTDYQWVPATDIRRLTRRELAPIHPFAGAKRIEIDLSKQTVTCYEGNRVLFTTRCASGIGKRVLEDGTEEDLSTPEGDHTVILKQVSRHMSNRPRKPEDPVPADLFDLPGVPWDTFFDRSGAAIHGTYWHNDFGAPRSHGCVNVSIEAARWIYRWVYPIGGAEDDFIQGDKRVGTPIRIFKS